MPLAIADTYTYSVPDAIECPQPGVRVLVPLGKSKTMVGIVLRSLDESEECEFALRDIIAVLDTEPMTTPVQIDLWKWIAQYYMCSIGEVMAAALPSKVADKVYSFSSVKKRRVVLPSYQGEIEPIHPLDHQQSRAEEEILQSWQSKDVVLLHGVTSSGKTEVYIHLIDRMLQQGKQVLYLVPEIALTTQLTDRLQVVFGDKIIVYHSRISDAQRAEIYRQQLYPQPRLIVGARSAVFLPFQDLGLIIVDEEHEPSYKQQDPAPRYHARSAAIMLAQLFHAKVLLGTATPSVETYFNAQNGKYGLVSMTQRYQGLQLPHITLIDLQRQYHRKEMYGHFSDPVVERIREELARHKQIIVFQNRRGFAPYLECTACGTVPKCTQCDVSLTYHKPKKGQTNGTLVCHYCGYTMEAPKACPACGKPLKDHGMGTEKIEDELANLFPEARIERMDLDSTRKKDAYQQIITDFAEHKVDILVGTQMVTKGLHFDDVSLVVVLNASNLMNQPDFRCYERAFQMMEQVSGRAGRKAKEGEDHTGEVMIQTYDPEHFLFSYLNGHDYAALYHQQLAERQAFAFPPYHRLIMITLRHRELSRLETASRLLQERLHQIFSDRCSPVIVPSIARVQNQYIRTIRLRIEAKASFLKAKEMVHQQIQYVESQADCRGITILPDVDPV